MKRARREVEHREANLRRAFPSPAAMLRAALLLLLLASACASPSSASRPERDRPQATGPNVPPPTGPARPPAPGDCPARPPAPPSWALGPDAPRPTKDDVTGQWVAVPLDAPPGPVVRGPFCYEGAQVLTLVQHGDAVDAVWVLRNPVQGVLRVRWTRRAEAATGRRAAGRLRLHGWTATERGTIDSPAVQRDCRAVESELAWDEPRGHLVGTRDGAPVRYAPLTVQKVDRQVNPCGPKPP